MGLQRASSGPSNEDCLTLADLPPAESHADISALERCSAIVADDVELMADLGRAYESTRRRADAEAVYQRVVAIDPDYADVQGRLAALLLQRGAAAEARAHVTEALRVQPDRKALVDLLARVTSAQAGHQP